MGYKTITTKIASARSTKSKQTTSYQYPTGTGVVLSGSSINSQTTAYLDVTTPGAARTFTAVSGGGTTTIISNLQYLDTNNLVTNAVAVSTTGGNILINGNGFSNTSRVYVNNQLVTNTYVNSNAIIATLSANSVGNVSLAIFNSSGQSGVFSNSNVRFSGAPSWVSSGAVSSYNDIASNIALEASGDGTLTYSLQSGSGSLPSGVSLVSGGYLSGTATGYTSDTVVTFTLIVTDAEGQAAQQNYSYTVFIGDTYFKQTTLLLSADVANTFISDASTNNFLITRNGDTRPSRLSPYWPGGWSGYFDGSGDYLTVPHNTGFNFGTGDFTIEFWLYQSAQNTDKFLVDTYYFDSSKEYGWLVTVNAQGKLVFTAFVIAGNGGIGVTSASALAVNKWVHCAVVRSGTTVTLYVDGLNAGSGTLATDIAYTRPLQIAAGGYYNGPYLYFFNGYLSNIRILKGTALYTANFTPSTTSLTSIANTSALILRDSILADNSAYNGIITRGGDTRLTTFSPFNTAPYTITANTNSVYFDGTGDQLSIANSADFNLPGDFTIELWANFLSVSSVQTLVGNYVGAASGWALQWRSDTTRYAFGHGDTQLIYVTGTPTLNTWNHIAVTRSGTSLRFFINGTLSNTVTNSTSLTSSNPLIIGSLGGQQYTVGYISNFRVVKGNALYTANFTPSTTALTAVANTSILTCQANTIIDSNTTPKTITIAGNPNVSLANPFGETVSTISNYTWSAASYGSSAYFDGATATRLSFASNSAFAFGTGAYTLETWVYLTAYGSPATNLIDCGGATNSIGLSIDGSSAALFINKYGSGSILSTTSTVPLNSWTHVAASRVSTGSNDTRLFINGRLAAIGTDNNNWTVTTSPSIGGINLSGYTVSGHLADARITKGTALYTTPFIPPTAPLAAVANVSVLTLQSDIGSNSVQFVDQSPNNHLITRSGNAHQGSYSPLVPTSWSAYFDGTGDYLQLSSQAMSLSSNNFTIEMWVYLNVLPTSDNWPASWSSTGVLIAVGSANLGDGFNCIIGSTQIFCQNNDSKIGSATHGMVANRWYHVAYVRNGNTISFFVNGNLCGTVSFSTAIGTGASTWIGSETGQGAYINGYISNLRVVNGTALYTANFTPATTTLTSVTNTSLLALTGPTMTDTGPNRFAITRNGDTRVTPFGPFAPHTVTPKGYSVYFDGTGDYLSGPTTTNINLSTGDWTIECWAYADGVWITSYMSSGTGIAITGSIYYLSSNGSTWDLANGVSIGTWVANQWNHFAFVRYGNVITPYVNGIAGTSTTTSSALHMGGQSWGIGNNSQGFTGPIGYMSNLRFVKGTALYTGAFTPPAAPLTAVANTSLLTCHTTSIIDGSSNAFAITVNGNARPTELNPFGYTTTTGVSYDPVLHGGSAYFDGTGDWVTTPNGNVFDLSNSATNFIIEAWVYNTGPGSNRGIVGARQNNQLQGWCLYIGTNNTFYMGSTIVGQSYTDRQMNTTVIPGNSWTHVALVKDATGYTAFVNGIAGTKLALTGGLDYQSGQPLIVGALGSQGELPFLGYISNLRILKGTALYTTPFVPPAAPGLPTQANTSLLLNYTNSGVTDSAYRNTLETVGDARVVTSTKKYGTGSYYFDGTGDYMTVSGTSTELAFGTGDFTIEFWINPTNNSQSAVLYEQRPSNTNGVYPYIGLSTGSLEYFVNSVTRIIQSGTVTAAVWQHIALCRASGSTRMFLDGVQVGSTYTDTNNYLNGTNRPIIGANGFNNTLGHFNGYIDDLRITKGYARYTANFTAPTAAFVVK